MVNEIWISVFQHILWNSLHYFIYNSLLNCTFVVFLAPMPSWEGGRGGKHRHVKRRLSTLCSWRFRTSQLLNQVNEHCNGRCPWVCNMPLLYPYMNIVWVLWLHIYISAWGSALLVQLDWAMRRPWNAGRVMIRLPRFFLYVCVIKLKRLNSFGESSMYENIWID